MSAKYEYEEEYSNNIDEMNEVEEEISNPVDDLDWKPKHSSKHKYINIFLCAALLASGAGYVYYRVSSYIDSTKVKPYVMVEGKDLSYYLGEVTKHPREIELYIQIAKMYADNGNFEKAISYLNSGLEVASGEEKEEINALLEEYQVYIVDESDDTAYEVIEDTSIAHYIGELYQNPEDLDLYTTISDLYVEQNNFQKAIDYLQEGLKIADESEIKGIEALIEQYTPLVNNTDSSISYTDILNNNHANTFALMQLSGSQPAIVFCYDNYYGIESRMWGFGGHEKTADLKLTYLEGTELYCARYTNSINGRNEIDLTNDANNAGIIIYDPNTYEGGTIMPNINDSQSFTNEQEMSEALSKIEYVELKDGEVVFSEAYQDLEREVTFYSVNEDTLSNLNNDYNQYLK